MESPRSLATGARAVAVLAAALVAVVAGTGSVGASTTATNPKHFFWAPGQSP